MKKVKEKSKTVRGQDPMPTGAIKVPVEEKTTKSTKITNTTNVGFVENVTKPTNVAKPTKSTTAATTTMPSTLGKRISGEAKKAGFRAFVLLFDVVLVVLEGDRANVVGRATIAGILGKN